ncbi:MAG: Phosphoribulokinase/uridine kinase family protein [Anaerolineaceae bacterium 46_22]|nr:MAG: Phosphoribulokinase/uridine kinase family protein [Anaerolineaceae bacterium 46_22]
MNKAIKINEKMRDTVEVIVDDGTVMSGPRHTPIGEFMRVYQDPDKPQIVGAIVNNDLRELTFPISADAKVTPIDMGNSDGARIYRRSLTFLLEVAFLELFPKWSLTIDHSVSSGAYFCHVPESEPFKEQDLVKLDAVMREIVDADEPLIREKVALEDAKSFFRKHQQEDKLRLLNYRNDDFLVLYSLRGKRDYHHGYMVPSSGYLKWFNLKLVGNGFVIQFPRRHAPSELSPMPSYPQLLTSFRQYGEWLETLGIQSVGALNDAIKDGRINEVILVSEALHAQQISRLANEIRKKRDQIKVILIAGPSSSGKTTFAKRLTIQLLTEGISPFALEMDNYFVNRQDTPRDEDGNLDFEHIDALNRALLNQHIQELTAGKEVQLRRYDFHEGLNKPGETVSLTPGQVIILEGIHGLNPRLLEGFPPEHTFRIYVSCLTQLNLDRHNRISTTDTRELRRILRDARDRGYSAQQTISNWEMVRRGEKRHIFPYQENADVMFNSALAYELTALKPLVEPLLRQVPYGTREYIEAKRLFKFLQWFLPTDQRFIPDNSILREFIGDSILQDFKIWQNNQRNDY